jgi:hypothetical protein
MSGIVSFPSLTNMKHGVHTEGLFNFIRLIKGRCFCSIQCSNVTTKSLNLPPIKVGTVPEPKQVQDVPFETQPYVLHMNHLADKRTKKKR